jgi:hypothetical protein
MQLNNTELTLESAIREQHEQETRQARANAIAQARMLLHKTQDLDHLVKAYQALTLADKHIEGCYWFEPAPKSTSWQPHLNALADLLLENITRVQTEIKE